MNTTPIHSKLFHSCSSVHMDRYIRDPNQLYQMAIEQNLRLWSRRDVAGVLELVLQVRQLYCRTNISESLKESSIIKFSPWCAHDDYIFSITWSQWSKEWNYQQRLALVLLMILCDFYFWSACLDQRTKNIHSGQSGVRNMAGYIMMLCTDAAFCYIYMKAEWEKYKASTKCKPTFISKGFTNWKDTTAQ